MPEQKPDQPERTVVDVDGRRLALTNLGKVLYPTSGTTKAEVLQYVTAVAPALLTQLRDRLVTRVRWPHGTGGESFFEKNVPAGAPAWLRRVTIESHSSRRHDERVVYPVIDDLAGLVWATNLSALELHVHQWRVAPDGTPLVPDRLVVDLDPGRPPDSRSAPRSPSSCARGWTRCCPAAGSCP